MSIRKSTIFIFSLLIVLTVWRMPASVVKRFVEGAPLIPFTLINTSGTLWKGNGEINTNEFPATSVSWSIPIVDILRLRPSVVWQLDTNDSSLKGKSSTSGLNVITSVSGKIGSTLLNQFFFNYDIRLDGSVSIEHLLLVNDRSKSFSISRLDGLLIWSGGEITYLLAKTPVTINSPLFELEIFDKNLGVIHAKLNNYNYNFPLLLASLTDRGKLTIKVTKAFTKIFGNEWPGSDSEEENVLELEEYIF